MSEYDALEVVGHGCGHNIIGTAGVGAAVALSSVSRELDGTVIVYGTPAEEGGNGKEIMAKHGAFKGIDAAMMIHPWNRDMVCNSATMSLVEVEYFGKAAHPCTPTRGINALDAMLIGFGAFNTFRQTLLRPSS
jgi:metal-dependent amidase/aminoacylase/carboxypeptidase family protein